MNWNSAKFELGEIAQARFPELKETQVELLEIGAWKRLAFLFTSPFSPRIYAAKDIVETLPDPAVRGLLAHELIHMIQFQSLKIFPRLWLLTAYLISKRRRAELERAADIGAVERGFGEDLLAAKEYGRLHYPQRANYGQFYLTEDEIRRRMNVEVPAISSNDPFEDDRPGIWDLPQNHSSDE